MPRHGPITNRHYYGYFNTSILGFIKTFDAKTGTGMVYDRPMVLIFWARLQLPVEVRSTVRPIIARVPRSSDSPAVAIAICRVM